MVNFDSYRGVIVLFHIIDGTIKEKGTKIRIFSGTGRGTSFGSDPGVNRPRRRSTNWEREL